MKKTIAILLTTTGLAFGAVTQPVLNVPSVTEASYTLEGYFGNDNNITVAVTLDMEALASTELENVTPLFWVNGKYVSKPETAASEGIEILNSSTTNKVVFELCGGNGKSGENHSGYQALTNLKDVSFTWTSYQAISLVMVATEKPASTKDPITLYVTCIDKTGTTTTYSGNASPSWGVSSIYNIGVNTTYVDSLQVYNSAYSVDDAKNLGKEILSPAVPEPTTATLSLLALAGLAARRRRA